MRLNSSALLARFYRHRPGFILLHAPKTGGSSLASAIRRHYRFSHFNVRSEASSLAARMLHGVDPPPPELEATRQDLRTALVFYAAAQGIKFITGHVWYRSQMAALREHGYQTITLLRHPVDRWYSLYFYRRFKEGAYARIETDFEEFIESAAGREAGQVYLRYFSGSVATYDGATAIGHAKRHLDELSLVGFLEELPALERAFRRQYGLALRIPHKRRSPIRKDPARQALARKYKESREWRDRVAALCRQDIELYEYARSRFAVSSGD